MSPAAVGSVTTPLPTTTPPSVASGRSTLHDASSAVPLKSSRYPGGQLVPVTVIESVSFAVPPLPSDTVTFAE